MPFRSLLLASVCVGLLASCGDGHGSPTAAQQGPTVAEQAQAGPPAPAKDAKIAAPTPAALGRLESTRVITPDKVKGELPILSIVVAEADLYDPAAGIVANASKRGREWERPAQVSYFVDGSVVHESRAGVRYHGGASREVGALRSLRLFFRKEYESSSLPRRAVFGADGPDLRRVIARFQWTGQDTVRATFSTVLAAEFHGRFGAAAVAMRPVALFVNGEDRGLYALVEHPGRKQWESHVGHDRFHHVSYRGNADAAARASHSELRNWALNTPTMTMDAADAVVDLDKLSRHLLAIAFLGVSDWQQGIGVKDLTASPPRWEWVAYDLDHAFFDHGRRRRAIDQVWQQESIELITTGAKFHKPTIVRRPVNTWDVRALIFTRLAIDSAEYRRYLVKLAEEVLSKHLTPEYVEERIAHYERLAKPYAVGQDRLEVVRTFMKGRPEFFRAELERQLAALAGGPFPPNVPLAG